MCENCEYWEDQTYKGKKGGSCTYSGPGNCVNDKKE